MKKNPLTRLKTDTIGMNEVMLNINEQAAHMHSNREHCAPYA